VIFLEELQKIKSSGFVAYVGTFLFSHDILNAEGDERINKII
jgi:hypothetical protein